MLCEPTVRSAAGPGVACSDLMGYMRAHMASLEGPSFEYRSLSSPEMVAAKIAVLAALRGTQRVIEQELAEAARRESGAVDTGADSALRRLVCRLLAAVSTSGSDAAAMCASEKSARLHERDVLDSAARYMERLLEVHAATLRCMLLRRLTAGGGTRAWAAAAVGGARSDGPGARGGHCCGAAELSRRPAAGVGPRERSASPVARRRAAGAQGTAAVHESRCAVRWRSRTAADPHL